MLRNKTLIPLLLALGFVLSLASCASDTAVDAPDAQPNKAFLQVQVSVDGASATRAYTGPNGGEDGDGREEGLTNENTIKKLSVLLYSSEKSDLSDTNAKIEYVYTFNNLTSSTETDGTVVWKTSAQEIDRTIVGKNYHVLIIANSDELSGYKDKTISDVKDLEIKKVVTRNASDVSLFSDFVMSSHKDVSLDFQTGKGTETDPYVVSADVERLAARIDIVPSATYSSTDNAYYYNVTDASKNVIGGFKLEKVVPTNVLTSGEYFIKRTSATSELTNLTYFGEETMDATTKKSTNYVVCPLTKSTTSRGTAQGTDDFYQVKDATTNNGFILDYVMENTTTDNNKDYSTGLLFKGTYYDKDSWDADNVKPKADASGTAKEYSYTIRHSDPSSSSTSTDPMYYGIVRNNIYRVEIEGITGKGTDGMNLKIQVRKWATYTHEETTM